MIVSMLSLAPQAKCLATCPVSFLCIIQATITRSTKPKRLAQARCLATYFIENINCFSVSVAYVLVTLWLWWLATILTGVRMHSERSVSVVEESI